MLTAFAHQMMGQIIRLSNVDDAIELAELMESVASEKEDKLIVFQDFEFAHLEIIAKKVFVTAPSKTLRLNIFKKIPVPPPEFV